MNALRNHIEAARRQYRAARYPGDLAAEVLPARARRIGAWLLSAGGIVAAAALIAVVIHLRNYTPQIEQATEVAAGDSAANEQADQMVLGASWPALSVPEAPADLSLTPPTQDFSVAMPSFTFNLSETEEQESHSTTREAV